MNGCYRILAYLNCSSFRCEACREGWPIAAEMLDDAPGYRCEKCHTPMFVSDTSDRKHIKCQTCHHRYADGRSLVRYIYHVYRDHSNCQASGVRYQPLYHVLYHRQARYGGGRRTAAVIIRRLRRGNERSDEWPVARRPSQVRPAPPPAPALHSPSMA